MFDGLNVTRDQFLDLPKKQKDLVIFDNVTHIKNSLENYKVHRKIQYVWLSSITTILATSILMILKKVINF